jgi:hypothetical protein
MVKVQLGVLVAQCQIDARNLCRQTAFQESLRQRLKREDFRERK